MSRRIEIGQFVTLLTDVKKDPKVAAYFSPEVVSALVLDLADAYDRIAVLSDQTRLMDLCAKDYQSEIERLRALSESQEEALKQFEAGTM